MNKHRDFATYLLYFYYLSATQTDLKVRNSEMIHLARARTLRLLHEARGMEARRTKAPKPNKQLAEKIHLIIFGSGVLAMALGTKSRDVGLENTCLKLVQQILEADS